MLTLGIFKILGNPSSPMHITLLPNNSLFPRLCRNMWKIFLACFLSSHTELAGGVILYTPSISQHSGTGPAARGLGGWSRASRKCASGGSVSRIHPGQSPLSLTDSVSQPGCFSLLTMPEYMELPEIMILMSQYLWDVVSSVITMLVACRSVVAFRFRLKYFNS